MTYREEPDRQRTAERVVVVGNGMAGTRFVQDLRAHDPQRRFDITVIGAEPEQAYNRVLLSSVLAGKLTPADVEMVPASWYATEGVELLLGVGVEHIDRKRRRVLTDRGEYVGYDHLVLATGSRAWVPPIEGAVDGDELDRDVAVFRTLQDCRAIMARVDRPEIRRVVVLGGGLLGLEAARGLAGRGVEVEVVHAVDRLMERQLDAEAGRVLAGTLRSLGVRIRLDAQVRAYDEVAGQRVVVLEDGTRIAADLLIVACGVRPNTGLARAAKLAVDRGIVVDGRMTSVSDPRVHAIGECAQFEGQVYGLVAPAWEQAGVLADALTGGDRVYAGSRLVTRLKAEDIDLAAMGETDVDDISDGTGTARNGARAADRVEVLRFADPIRGTYQKLVIRNDRVTGAIMLGGAETVGTVTQLFDRVALAPADRRALIFPGVADAGLATDPADLADDDLVCRCNTVTAGQIRHACSDGASTVAEVAMCTRATSGCGGCRDDVAGIVAAMRIGTAAADGANEAETEGDELAVPDRPDDVDAKLVEVPA
ncbi:FAD-dependent oxidoreductase [Phytoactinopolyspora halotolerans]|uniref:NAD(P)/FAD-dependent oxidoreductase n=1 Tax=Phytoactinopolyspora halotolerans TaxID=1981512 RepID=A0A6L9S5L9_9ACTN|nr:FAD-dependent oxidoreductase [Phytoactinopolyspora halotolerans]NED99369.1 NAD(P)/FAD-dependent oxidoreductase [Phytoactinopolyspora halotolerans]